MAEKKYFKDLSRRDYIVKANEIVRAEGAEALPAGARVRHEIFGAGTVLETDVGRGSYLIQFDSVQTPRRIAFRIKLEQL